MSLRPTAAVRGSDGGPLDRDDYASHLHATLHTAGGHDLAGISTPDVRLPVLSQPEALAAAALLDELAGVYPGEPIAQLARSLAGRIHDRLGL